MKLIIVENSHPYLDELIFVIRVSLTVCFSVSSSSFALSLFRNSIPKRELLLLNDTDIVPITSLSSSNITVPQQSKVLLTESSARTYSAVLAKTSPAF